MQTRIIVSAVIQQNDTLLFGRKRPDIGPYPNTWHLIGGGINPEEPLEQAIRREIHEEAGLTVGDLTPVYFGDDREPNKHGELTHYIFMVYHTSPVSGTPTAGDDIVTLSWIATDQLPIEELSDPTIRVFRQMGFLR